MMTLATYAVFAGTFGMSIYAIAGTVWPRLDRITAALWREPQPEFHPLAALVKAERHIAIRRWAAQSRPAAAIRPRAAA